MARGCGSNRARIHPVRRCRAAARVHAGVRGWHRRSPRRDGDATPAVANRRCGCAARSASAASVETTLVPVMIIRCTPARSARWSTSGRSCAKLSCARLTPMSINCIEQGRASGQRRAQRVDIGLRLVPRNHEARGFLAWRPPSRKNRNRGRAMLPCRPARNAGIRHWPARDKAARAPAATPMRVAMAFARAALARKKSPSRQASSCAERKSASWRTGARRACGAVRIAWRVPHRKNTTASAPMAPFLVAPKESTSTPDCQVTSAAVAPRFASALAKRAPSIVQLQAMLPAHRGNRRDLARFVDGATFAGLRDADAGGLHAVHGGRMVEQVPSPGDRDRAGRTRHATASAARRRSAVPPRRIRRG